jgi:hypothetical protein
MAGKPTAISLAKEWLEHAETADSTGMARLLADDAMFYADAIRGKRFKGREEIAAFLAESGFEATGYSYTAIDAEYAVVSLSLRRRLPSGGLADSTLAMVFKAEDGEIICMDAFASVHAALASIRR